MAKYNKQISMGYDPDTGRQKRKWIHANTVRELNEQIEKIHRAQEETPNTSDITFREYSQQWLEVYKAHRSARTREMYEYGLKKCAPVGRFPLKSVTKTQCQQIINDLWETPRAAKIARDTMKQVFKAAIADGIILRNPAEGLAIPDSQRTEKRLLTDHELEAIRDAELDPQDRMFVTILQVFGLRPAEALALRPMDFDFKNRILTISKAVELGNDNASRIKDTKTGVTRKIPIPDGMVSILRAYTRANPWLYLFANKDGSLMTKSGYRRMCERILRAWNISLGGDQDLDMTSGVTMYSFRHRRATDLYYLCQRGKITTKYAAEILGHSEAIFLQTYSHVDPKKEQKDALYEDLASVIKL